jgi:hypothetical protein
MRLVEEVRRASIGGKNVSNFDEPANILEMLSTTSFAI